jgi:hypothetical protein
MGADDKTIVVATDKLVGYLMSETHPIGQYKALFFLGLGYKPEIPERPEG